MHPLLVLIALVGGLLFISWLKRAPPAARNKALILAGGILLVLLAATGRLNWVFAAAGAAVVMLQRILAAGQLLGRFRSSTGARSGSSSEVRTDYLHMSLDHETGRMEGEVTRGRFAGRALSSMSLSELLALHGECATSDAQSGAVLEAYMDRTHPQWRESQAAGSARPPARSGMSRAEAIEILGVQASASEEEVVSAHRRLMQKLHPDRGGSTYLAAKLNEAKSVLLGT